VEPDSDGETYPISSQNESCPTDTKHDYPVHAAFFLVKTETEVRCSCYLVSRKLFAWFIITVSGFAL